MAGIGKNEGKVQVHNQTGACAGTWSSTADIAALCQLQCPTGRIQCPEVPGIWEL